MTKFICQGIAPKFPVQEVVADDWVDAAQKYHLENLFGPMWKVSPGEAAYFARVKVLDSDGVVNDTIVRTYYKGIFRSGGVPRKNCGSLSQIAKTIGYEDDPETLLDPWGREEEYPIRGNHAG